MGGKNSKPTTNDLVYALPRGNPTESVDMPLAKMEKYDLKTATATRVTVQPGWSWAPVSYTHLTLPTTVIV